MVRAVTPGSFMHPAATVEDMYRPERFARTAAGRLTSRPRSEAGDASAKRDDARPDPGRAAYAYFLASRLALALDVLAVRLLVGLDVLELPFLSRTA